jgi:hypothetical protein
MINSIDTNSVVCVTKDQICADVEGEIVLLNLNTGIYFGMNPLGTRIWELIQEPTSVSRVRDHILEEYDVEINRCQEDIINLLEKLKKAGLIDVFEGEKSYFQ